MDRCVMPMMMVVMDRWRSGGRWSRNRARRRHGQRWSGRRRADARAIPHRVWVTHGSAVGLCFCHPRAHACSGAAVWALRHRKRRGGHQRGAKYGGHFHIIPFMENGSIRPVSKLGNLAFQGQGNPCAWGIEVYACSEPKASGRKISRTAMLSADRCHRLEASVRETYPTSSP
jgi:hypothetical protein